MDYSKCRDVTVGVPAPIHRSLKKMAIEENKSLRDLTADLLESAVEEAGFVVLLREDEMTSG